MREQDITTKATIDKEEILLILSTKVLIPCKIIKVNKTFSKIRRNRTLKAKKSIFHYKVIKPGPCLVL